MEIQTPMLHHNPYEIVKSEPPSTPNTLIKSSYLENQAEVMFGNFQIHPGFCTQVVTNTDPLNNNNQPKTNANGRALAADRKRPYPCTLCSSKFGSKMELEEHQNSHTGQKPFECDTCNARFNRRSTLWNHKRIHSDAKPFVCTVCQMTFKWKNSLKCHKDMHQRKNETSAHLDNDLRQLTYATAAKRKLQMEQEENGVLPASSSAASINSNPLITTTSGAKKRSKSFKGTKSNSSLSQSLSQVHLGQPLQASALVPPSDHQIDLDTTSLDSLVQNQNQSLLMQIYGYSDMDGRHNGGMLALDDTMLSNLSDSKSDSGSSTGTLNIQLQMPINMLNPFRGLSTPQQLPSVHHLSSSLPSVSSSMDYGSLNQHHDNSQYIVTSQPEMMLSHQPVYQHNAFATTEKTTQHSNRFNIDNCVILPTTGQDYGTFDYSLVNQQYQMAEQVHDQGAGGVQQHYGDQSHGGHGKTVPHEQCKTSRFVLLFQPNVFQDGEAKIPSIVCAPNGTRTAIACADRSIALLDENNNQKDRFTCKPYGKKSFTILCMAFSPDSSCIAVGQSDNVLFIYKIGASWNEKKVIVNKFVQPSAVTCLSWPFDDKILVGQLDGKVRIGLIKTNKCSSLYKTDETVVSLQTHPKKTSFVSAHVDGSIILYNFGSRTQSKICTLQVPPYNLTYTNHGLVVATADRRVLSYTENGVVQQQFDYNDQTEKEFTAIACDPTAQNVVVASYDRIRLFSWSARRGAWDEGAPLDILNAYIIGALGWKMDGSTVYAGNICGAVFSVDCCLKRGMLKSRFETTYVAPSHVILRDVTNESRTSVISNKGLAIDELKIMGKDRFVVGYTSSTIVIADTESQKFSELEWQSGGHEKFYFDFNNCCLIINAGEVTVVEYGVDGPLGWVRTELTSPHLLSVQVSSSGVEDYKKVKKLAYLVDPTTISIINLENGQQECFINHPGPIDWIELNEPATKLLYRDKRSKVTLVDIQTDQRSVLLSFCTYVQWVPMSDVIVAQSGDNLSIWYNPDLPEQVSNMKIKGEVEAVLRDADRTEVIVQEPTAKVAYELDNTQIEFGAALEKRDFDRAVAFLEANTGGSDAYSMWTRVADLALEHFNLFVAQRCYAAIGDVAKAKKLHEIQEDADEAAVTIGGDGTHYYKVRAKLSIMARKFKDAERTFLEQNDIESAISMYTNLHKWDEALELAKVTNYPGYDQLKTSYLRALSDTGQDSKAAELKASDGDTMSAIALFMKANKPLSALSAANNDSVLANDETVMRQIADSLVKSQLYDKAGDVYEKLKDFDNAIEYYKKGDAYGKAIQLARFAFPEKVVVLEEEWGRHLEYIGQYDAAVSHFVEANDLKSAVEAAIKAKEWPKALSIVENIQDQKIRTGYYGEIADHYSNKGDFERAERLFVEAGLFNDAIMMYGKNSRWVDAFRLSEEFHGKEATISSYLAKAEDLEEHGRFAEAEQLYVIVGMPRKAIQMYDRETRKRFASQYEERGDLRAAEEEFLKAGDFRAAVNMYKENELWSDAFRIAKTEGGENMEKQVLFLWAKSLGGDAAVKLLNKHGWLIEGIDFACETGAYDLAFDLARIGAKERLPTVHGRLASQLEEEGRQEDASKHYIEGNQPELAVEMFIRDNDWAAAERVAKEHCPNLLPDVYVGQARRAIEEGDHLRAETFLLRANKPEIILRYFSENEMWPDALRIAQNYLPHQAALIQEEYEKSELRNGARGVESFVAQAKEWEKQGDWRKAVSALLRVNSSSTEDIKLIKTCTEKAADLTMKFLMGDEEYVTVVLGALDDADCNEKAAELLLLFGQTRQAINALCRAKQWSKAKQVAEEYLPDMIPEIEKIYKESLKNEGRLGELIDVDVVTAIDMMIENDQWDKALETARSQNYRPLLDKYVAQYAAILVHRHDYTRVIATLERFGASANPANFSIYKMLLEEVLSKPRFEYSEIARIRNVHLDVFIALKKESSPHLQEFNRSLWALHLLAMRSALEELADSVPEAPRLCLKQSLSLLRYSDILPPDRIFYEAGSAAKDVGKEYDSLGFLLLNHYLDLVDAIEEGNGELVDYSPFENSDIPTEVSLPTKQWLESAKHEDIKEWVLAASVDDSHTKDLIYDKRRVFEASLNDNRGGTAEPCLVTGYPVIDQPIHIGTMVAEKDNLNKFLIVIKNNQTENLLNVQNFVVKWAGSPLAIAL
ncbi:unnamed protein product [Caenorhabditis sp. 36 PRJEB53466]|nr:unnamed protein product [Caenorhabditis sp. 36 PRJEB53466]